MEATGNKIAEAKTSPAKLPLDERQREPLILSVGSQFKGGGAIGSAAPSQTGDWFALITRTTLLSISRSYITAHICSAAAIDLFPGDGGNGARLFRKADTVAIYLPITRSRSYFIVSGYLALTSACAARERERGRETLTRRCGFYRARATRGSVLGKLLIRRLIMGGIGQRSKVMQTGR